jgi:hypothetical protein
MARILAYTTPARGHLFPLTPVLDELGRRGHRIALRTLASRCRRCGAVASTPLRSATASRRSPTTTGAPATRGRRWPARSGSSPSAPSTTAPTLPGRSTRSGRTRCWSTSTPGGPSPPPRHGQAPGRCSVPTRCPSARGTCRRSGRGCRRHTARWGGYATSCCARSCSGRWSARWPRRSIASATSWGWRRSMAPTTSSAGRRCCST